MAIYSPAKAHNKYLYDPLPLPPRELIGVIREECIHAKLE
jgi:hypothetical protein